MRVLVAAILAIAVCANGAPALGADQAAINQAVRRGITFLRQNPSHATGHASLVAYALMKASIPHTDPLVLEAVNRVKSRVTDGQYKPGPHHIYEAGVELMLLESADPYESRGEMQAIVDYIVAEQRADGHWDYPNQQNGGDTSITQYAVLGLWAAERAGIKAPRLTWSNAARWLLQTQVKQGAHNGGFAYHPRKGSGSEGSATHSMAAAGTGSLYIIALHLDDPNAKKPEPKKEPEPEPEPMPTDEEANPDGSKTVVRYNTYDILEKIDFSRLGGPSNETTRDDNAPSILEQIRGTEQMAATAEEPEAEAPTLAKGVAEAGGRRGIGWLNRYYAPFDRLPNSAWGPMYYLYGLERAAAMADTLQVGGRDWFADGSDFILRIQEDDGGWSGKNSSMSRQAATSFALLFLTKSTSKLMRRTPAKEPEPVEYAGTGLLAGGRGLPDLDELVVENGQVKKKDPMPTPLDDLLSALTQTGVSLEDVQQELIKQVQTGDREALIEKKDFLLEIVRNDDPEIRRTALWALGRCEEVLIAPQLIRALQDPNLGVMVEAHNSLCVLSRLPQGHGLPDGPLEGLPADAGDAQKEEAIAKWQEATVKRWTQWYNQIRPYDEREGGSLVVR